MSRLGAKTYSRKTDCKTSLQFDHLLAEKGNKPSTAKVSVAAVHRWGMTSFTSLRKTHLNGQKDLPGENIDTVKRFKRESKTTVAPPSKDPFSFESDIDLSSMGRPPSGHGDSKNDEGKLAVPKPKKFFKSGNSGGKTSPFGTSSSKKNDFDALRLSVPQNCNFVKHDDNGTHQTTESRIMQNCRSSEVEDNCRLFETLVPSERSHSTSANISVPLDQSYSDHQKSVNFYEQVSSQSLLLLSDKVRANQLPPSDLFRSADSQLMQSNVLQQQNTAFSNNVISDSSRTYRVDNSGLDMPGVISSMSTFDEIQTVHHIEPPKKENVCDLTMQQQPATKPKLDSSTYSVDVASNIATYRSDSPLSKDDEKCSLSSNPESSSKEENLKVKNVSRPKKIFNTSKKPKAVYNHRHWQSLKEETAAADKESEKEADLLSSEFDDPTDHVVEKTLTRETKQIHPSGEVVNSVKCPKPVKQLYTVVRNVKQAYQCHESGETQEFNDDIEYLLDGLQDCNGIGTRCLSVLGLATKCMGPAFRIHLRAHGTMPKIFSALQDAPSDPNLALCTATLLFVLSQDRLTMDIEASTLSMMLQLLETDPEIGSPEKELDLILEDPALCAMQEKHREKVFQLCEQMQQKGHAKHLKLDNINTGILAMETLLSLTSRKAGEWFKEEMRTLHGLDHIVDTITSCVESLMPEQTEVIFNPNEAQMDKIRKVDRCLRVLENVTYMNYENQDYLLQYKDSVLVNYCLSLMKLCKSHLLENQPEDIETAQDDASQKKVSPVLFCLLSVMKVLLNITFENSFGSSRVGAEKGLMENVLMCILQVPKAVPTEKRFDLLVLSLGVMINLVEHSSENRKHLIEMHSLGSFDTINDGYEILATEALVEVLHSRLEAAQLSEEQADELLSSTEVKHATDKKDSENAASQAECLEETLMKTLQKAGKHMEHSIIAAYISLLLGCVIQNNQEYADIIRDHVPDGKFDMMVEVLKKFMSFVSLTGAVGNTGVKSIQRIIEVLSSS